MSNLKQSNEALRLLDASAVELVSGGFAATFDDTNWCGSAVIPIPWPPRRPFDLGQVLTIPTALAY